LVGRQNTRCASPSEGSLGQALFNPDIEGGDHVAHDGVEPAKYNKLDDAGIAVSVDEAPLDCGRD
jgi:hypothetical protein